MHHCGPSGSTQTSEFEGQIVVTARCSGPKQGLNVQSLTSIVKSHLETFGEIMAWAVITISFPTIVIRVEFFDCTVIDKLLKLSDMQVAVWIILQLVFYGLIHPLGYQYVHCSICSGYHEIGRYH